MTGPEFKGFTTPLPSVRADSDTPMPPNNLRPAVMGILNVTPDSFSDGGRYLNAEKAVEHALAMAEQGASYIDIGGESTRPGAEQVPLERELERVIPVIELLREETAATLSVDTYKPAVMRAAVRAGAGMINDVKALREPGATETCAELAVPVCLMHMQGEPRKMQQRPRYPNGVTRQVGDFFKHRVKAALAAGIARSNLYIDPGFGFGKTLKHNYELLRDLHRFKTHKIPIIVGVSRKSMIGKLLDVGPDRRLAGSLSAAVVAAMKGADILRVHDVAETVQALAVLQAATRPELL